MQRKFYMSIVFLFTAAFSFVFAQSHTGKIKPVKKSKSILILKDSSNLETAVSQILRDSLLKLGYQVKETALADAGREKASSYKISIIFNAINPGREIDPRIRKFIESKGTASSKVNVYTVWGTVYDKQDKRVDAMSQASKALRPQLIADHILRSLEL
ncbi:MAG: hypothetical protein JXA18_07835 [Chitinispirillaceae bacterium]|nr:hypothetical protein [Chitinispirillaceae bacterium]